MHQSGTSQPPTPTPPTLFPGLPLPPLRCARFAKNLNREKITRLSVGHRIGEEGGGAGGGARLRYLPYCKVPSRYLHLSGRGARTSENEMRVLSSLFPHSRPFFSLSPFFYFGTEPATAVAACGCSLYPLSLVFTFCGLALVPLSLCLSHDTFRARVPRCFFWPVFFHQNLSPFHSRDPSLARSLARMHARTHARTHAGPNTPGTGKRKREIINYHRYYWPPYLR